MRPHCLRSRSDYFWTFALNLSLKFSTTKRRIYFQGGTPIIESLLISYHQLNTPPVIDWKIHRPEAKSGQSGRRSSLFVWFSQKKVRFWVFLFRTVSEVLEWLEERTCGAVQHMCQPLPVKFWRHYGRAAEKNEDTFDDEKVFMNIFEQRKKDTQKCLA